MYELWDVDSGNLIDEYATEASALEVVAEYLREGGAGAVEGLSLLFRTPQGEARPVAEGDKLARRAAVPVQSAP